VSSTEPSAGAGVAVAPTDSASPWHRLNPLTKAVAAIATTAAVVLIGGYAAPILLLAFGVGPGALIAGIARPVALAAFRATLPIAIAVGLVSTFGLPGDTVLLRLGPFAATLEGLDAGALISLRLFVMAAALALYGLTTPARALVADLERRGVAPQLAFAAGSILGAVPALLEQARIVRDAQRSRGLDIDAGVVGRMRGVVPLFGPVVVGMLHRVEARSLALEARAFGRPGRRALLWAPSDTRWERVARWLLLTAIVARVVVAASGALPRLP
jgi:energy-coupling factor transporter transmembrane protein EcfT